MPVDGEHVLGGPRTSVAATDTSGYWAVEPGKLAQQLGVKSDEAKATFKDGVLEIAMPAGKPPEKHGRQVEIK